MIMGVPDKYNAKFNLNINSYPIYQPTRWDMTLSQCSTSKLCFVDKNTIYFGSTG